MTPLAYVLLGVFGGILVTAPLGPVNVMIIQRSVRYGFLSGASAGIGAAVADILFATIAAFGISAVRTFVDDHAKGIQLVGGTLVFLIGVRIMWRHARLSHSLESANSHGAVGWRSLGTTFALTITNPATVFGFIAYFGALGDWGPPEDDHWGSVQLVLGVGIGTIAWWCGLAAVVTRLRVRFTDDTLARFNMIAGIVMMGFGAGILGRLSVTYFKLI